jgi:hypothetical protein
MPPSLSSAICKRGSAAAAFAVLGVANNIAEDLGREARQIALRLAQSSDDKRVLAHAIHRLDSLWYTLKNAEDNLEAEGVVSRRATRAIRDVQHVVMRASMAANKARARLASEEAREGADAPVEAARDATAKAPSAVQDVHQHGVGLPPSGALAAGVGKAGAPVPLKSNILLQPIFGAIEALVKVGKAQLRRGGALGDDCDFTMKSVPPAIGTVVLPEGLRAEVTVYSTHAGTKSRFTVALTLDGKSIADVIRAHDAKTHYKSLTTTAINSMVRVRSIVTYLFDEHMSPEAQMRAKSWCKNFRGNGVMSLSDNADSDGVEDEPE